VDGQTPEPNIDGALTVEELVESVNLSVAHFSEMFRKSTGPAA
jgi:transcriptional regulator GlxA family with amidase domain